LRTDGIGSRIAVARNADQYRLGNRQDPHDSTGAITSGVGVASHGQGWKRRSPNIADDSGRDLGIFGWSRATATRPDVDRNYAAARCAGWGAQKHARDLQEKNQEVASHLLKPRDDIDVADGLATVTGTDRVVTFKQIAKAVYSI